MKTLTLLEYPLIQCDMIDSFLGVLGISFMVTIFALIYTSIKYILMPKELKSYLSKCNELKYNYKQKDVIKEAYKAKVDLTLLMSGKFDEYQMNEILQGLKEKIDVQQYSNPDLTSFEMHSIRHKLQDQYLIDRYGQDSIQLVEKYNRRHYYIKNGKNIRLGEVNYKGVLDELNDNILIFHHDTKTWKTIDKYDEFSYFLKK